MIDYLASDYSSHPIVYAQQGCWVWLIILLKS